MSHDSMQHVVHIKDKAPRVTQPTVVRARRQVRAALPCHSEPALGEMFAAVRSEALLTARLAAISHQLSDASLAQARPYTCPYP